MSNFDENLLTRIADLEQRLERLETQEAYRISGSTNNVSNPPTDAELDTAFGTPATVGDGFQGNIDDNTLGTTYWHVETNNGRWTYVSMTRAV